MMPPDQKPLARLEPVPIRTYWESEASEFTPWLARDENLELLGNAIGLGLTEASIEQQVGSFRLDIECKGGPDRQIVIVENQLDGTNHEHLGQIITYTAGRDAKTVVWIARSFSDEHRAALDWLNNHTPAGINFFGVVIELWKIGDSPPAPRFNVVFRPNDWVKPTSDDEKQLLEYWNGFERVVREDPGPLRPPRPLTDLYVDMSVGRAGVALIPTFSRRPRWIGVEIYLKGPLAKARFDQLEAQRAAIDIEIPGLDWQRLPGRQPCRIILKQKGVDPTDRSDWANQHNWLLEKVKLFDRVFRPRVSALEDSAEPADIDGSTFEAASESDDTGAAAADEPAS